MFALVLTKLTMKLFWLLKKNYIIVISKKHPLMFFGQSDGWRYTQLKISRCLMAVLTTNDAKITYISNCTAPAIAYDRLLAADVHSYPSVCHLFGFIFLSLSICTNYPPSTNLFCILSVGKT